MRILLVFIMFSINNICFSKTNSYFAITGDRVMINLRSGYGFTPEADKDAEILFEDLQAPIENSMMGRGKKITVGSSLTLIVADRGQGQFDGTIMITPGPGVKISEALKRVEIHWQGEEAQELFSYFRPSSGGYQFESFAGNLQIKANENKFYLEYQEVAPTMLD